MGSPLAAGEDKALLLSGDSGYGPAGIDAKRALVEESKVEGTGMMAGEYMSKYVEVFVIIIIVLFSVAKYVH